MQMMNHNQMMMKAGDITPPELDPETRNIQAAVEENNLARFLSFNLTRMEILSLRFRHSLNVVQGAAYFGSEKILLYLKELFKDDEQAKSDLVHY
jgi:hypothetical protein